MFPHNLSDEELLQLWYDQFEHLEEFTAIDVYSEMCRRGIPRLEDPRRFKEQDYPVFALYRQ